MGDPQIQMNSFLAQLVSEFTFSSLIIINIINTFQRHYTQKVPNPAHQEVETNTQQIITEISTRQNQAHMVDSLLGQFDQLLDDAVTQATIRFMNQINQPQPANPF